MPAGAMLGRRGWHDTPHGGLSDDPLARQLVNAVWGNPARDVFGLLPFNALTVLPAVDASRFTPGSASQITPQAFRSVCSTIAGNTGATLFAVVRITSVLEKGTVVELGNAALGDTGLAIGVGATAPDAVGNNLVGIRGGVNFDTSGAAIGQGLHSIAKTTDGTANEAWWVDGVRVSTTGTGASWGMTGTPALLLMNHGTATIGLSAGVAVGFAAAWGRVLGADEIGRMHENPFRITR